MNSSVPLAFVVFVAVFTTAAATGEPLARRLLGDRPRAAAAFGILLGFVVLSRWAFLLAELGILSRPFLYLPLVALAANPRGAARAIRALFEGTPIGLWMIVPVVFSVIVLVPMLQSPIVFWDTRVYHLGLPEVWIETGRFFRDPRFDFSYYPLLAEGLACYAFLVPNPDPSAILLALAPLLVAPALLEEFFPESDPPALRVSLWLLLLGTPALLTTALVAKGTPLFAVLCVASLVLRNPWACGAALGGAFASHLFAAAFAPLVLLVWARRFGGRDLLRGGAAAFLVGCPSYLCAFLATGDPVYPFLSPIPSPAEIDPMQSLRNLRAGAWEPLGIGSTFGLLLPLGLALGAALAPRQRTLWIPGAGGIVVLGLVLATSGLARYGAGAILLLLGVAAAAAARLPARVRAFASILALLGVAELFAILFWMGFLPPLRGPSPMIPEAPLAAWARTNLPPRPSVATLGVARPYGWGGRLEAVTAGRTPRIEEAIRAASGSETEIARTLRAQGFSHLVVHATEWRRLERDYALADLAPDEHRALSRLLSASRVVLRSGPASLFELPSERSRIDSCCAHRGSPGSP